MCWLQTRQIARSLIIATVLLIVPSGFARNKKQDREASYQAALQEYSAEVKLGDTRKEVEDYLRSKGASHFSETLGRSAAAILIKIGTEKHPWYCSEHSVYVKFVFEDEEYEGSRPSERDSDKLKSIVIYHQLEGCL